MAKRGKKVSRSKKMVRSSSVVKAPLGVKVISVLAYVLSAALLLSSIALFVARTALTDQEMQDLVISFIEDTSASTTVASDYAWGITAGAILMLLFAVLMYFVGRGLWHKQKWARVTMVVIAAVGFIGALSDFLRGEIVANIFDLIIDGWIAGYLLFNKKVQSFYK